MLTVTSMTDNSVWKFTTGPPLVSVVCCAYMQTSFHTMNWKFRPDASFSCTDTYLWLHGNSGEGPSTEERWIWNLFFNIARVLSMQDMNTVSLMACAAVSNDSKCNCQTISVFSSGKKLVIRVYNGLLRQFFVSHFSIYDCFCTGELTHPTGCLNENAG